MKRFKLKMSISLVLILLIALLLPIISMALESSINLGSASSFSLLAGSTITNTGTTKIDGSVGLHPGTVFSGQGTATVGGEVHLADAVALQAKNDFSVAYTNAEGRVGNTIGSELGGKTLTPGVYSAETSMQITGTLTLDGQNDPNAVFIFQAGSALTTASNSSIVLINGANPNNIFWQVGTSATLGTNSKFKGNILAMESITLTTGATVQGKLFAMTGAITLDSNSITNFVLVPSTTVATTTTAAATTTTAVATTTTAAAITTAVPTTAAPTTAAPTTAAPTTAAPTTAALTTTVATTAAPTTETPTSVTETPTSVTETPTSVTETPTSVTETPTSVTEVETLIIEEVTVPLGDLEVPLEIIELDEESIPLGDSSLPQTSEGNILNVFGFGLIISAIGIYIRKR